jgi:hypothetical protein
MPLTPIPEVAVASTAQSKPQVSPEVVALELVLQTGAIPYLDPAGEPRIRRTTDGTETLPWPVRSRETEAWVAKLYYEHARGLLSRGHIDRVLLYLEGKAAEQQQTGLELCDAIEADPLLGLLIRLIKHERFLKDTPENLLNRVNELAQGRLYLRALHRWPKSPETMGRRVRSLQPWLLRAGFTIEYQRDGRHRWIILSDSGDGYQLTPSPEPSLTNSVTGNGFRQSDGSDGTEKTNPEAEFDRIMKGAIA